MQAQGRGLRHGGKLLRRVLSIGRVAFGRGHMDELHLECGHVVQRLIGHGRKVGSLTGCPECK